MKKSIIILSLLALNYSLLYAQTDDNITKGEEAYKAQNYTKAEALLSAYIHSFQNNVAGYLRQLHGFDTANAFQKESVFSKFKINEEWARAYYDRALTYRKLNYPDNVSADLEMAVKIDPKYAPAYYQESKIKKEKGDKLGACICLGNALANSDTMEAAKIEYSNDFCRTAALQAYIKGKEKLEVGEFSEALQSLRLATLICPDSANYFVARAKTYVGLNKTDSALADLRHAIAVEPKNFNPYYERALIYEQSQKYKDAFDDLSQAIKINPNSVDAHLHRADDCENMQMEHSAVYDYEYVLKIKPDVGICYYKIAEYWHKIGNTDKACEYFQKAVDLGVEDAQAGVDDCKDAAAKTLTK